MTSDYSLLTEVADVIDSSHKTPIYVEHGVPMVRVTDVKYGALNLSSARHVSIETFRDYSRRYKAKPRDIIISRVGSYGNTAWVVETEFCLGQNVASISPKAIDARYLFFALNSSLIWSQIESKVVGSTQKTLSLKVIKELKVPRLGNAIEWDVGTLLGALDDRVALLRETNATLEAIAQALFKSWFVDFDPVRAKQAGRAPEGMDEATAALFPDGFDESELGLVPKGWRMSKLQDCCSRIESGGTPKRTVPKFWNGDISWLTSGEVRNPIVFATKEKITELGVKESSAKLWPVGTTVIAMYGATAGEVCLLAETTTANQACCGLIPRPNFRSFLFISARRERQNIASKSSGSAQQNLNKGLVSSHAVLLPCIDILARYEDVAGALLDAWTENERQAQTLATLRDTLLPRLISGRLRLPEAEAALEGVRVSADVAG